MLSVTKGKEEIWQKLLLTIYSTRSKKVRSMIDATIADISVSLMMRKMSGFGCRLVWFVTEENLSV